eukprot:2517638-Rhodomonas_salina.4
MDNPVAQMVLLRYPPPPPTADENLVPPAYAPDSGTDVGRTICSGGTDVRRMVLYQGCGAHTDCGFLTLLTQEDGVHGYHFTDPESIACSDPESTAVSDPESIAISDPQQFPLLCAFF